MSEKLKNGSPEGQFPDKALEKLYNSLISKIEEEIIATEGTINSPEIFVVRSRYRDLRYFKIISNSEVIFIPNCEFCRFGSSDNFGTLHMIDPSGGPYVSVGSFLNDIDPTLPNKKVIKIDRIEDKPGNYKLTVE